MTDLEIRFHKAMIDIYRVAKQECGYVATSFLQMVSEKGGLATAQTLLATTQPSEGFTTLWECGRLDLTVEALVLHPDYAPLFSEEEMSVAKKRLQDYGYKIT